MNFPNATLKIINPRCVCSLVLLVKMERTLSVSASAVARQPTKVPMNNAIVMKRILAIGRLMDMGKRKIILPKVAPHKIAFS